MVPVCALHQTKRGRINGPQNTLQTSGPKPSETPSTQPGAGGGARALHKTTP